MRRIPHENIGYGKRLRSSYEKLLCPWVRFHQIAGLFAVEAVPQRRIRWILRGSCLMRFTTAKNLRVLIVLLSVASAEFLLMKIFPS